MSLDSINTAQSSFIALTSSEKFLSDNELDQILNQSYEDAASEITTLPSIADSSITHDSQDFGPPPILPSIADSSMTDDLPDFGPPPKLPLLPQFACIESPETKETKKRKKEDEVLPAEVSANSTTKKKKTKPTKLSDRNTKSNKNFNKRLIDAVRDVVIYEQNPRDMAEQYNLSHSSLAHYIAHTNELLKPSTQKGKNHIHTRAEVVYAAVAKCLKLLKEDPSLKTSEEKKRERDALRVNALLQAINNNSDDITNDKLEKLEWGRRCFECYVKEAQCCVKHNTFSAKCVSYVKKAAIKYRELNK